jgi:hypothetical protein
VISPKVPNWSPDSDTKAFSNIDLNLPRNSTSKVLMRYGKFGYMQWATAADLVMRYGPLHCMTSYMFAITVEGGPRK